jgi:hypothetical protein
MPLTQVPPALLTSTTGTGSTVVLSASPTFTGTVTTPSVTFSDASSQAAAASPYGLKNRIINGAMVIDQRNAGAAITNTGASSAGYATDRFYTLGTQNTKLTMQQNAGSVTPPAGFTKYLGITTTTAYSVTSSDFFMTQQRIEGVNTADLGWGTADAKTVTLSFWVRSSLTGTFGGSLRNADGNRSYPYSYTISSANTWEQKSITIAGDTTGTWITTTADYGIAVIFGLGVGSTYSGTAGAWAGSNFLSATGATSVVGTNGATFYITGVQLEIGSSATPFERRLYNQELANCQRYFEKSYDIGTVPGTVTNTGLQYILGATDSANNVGLTLYFKTQKRTISGATFTPYNSASGASGTWTYTRNGASGSVAVNSSFLGEHGGLVYVGTGAAYIAAAAYGHWTISCEL